MYQIVLTLVILVLSRLEFLFCYEQQVEQIYPGKPLKKLQKPQTELQEMVDDKTFLNSIVRTITCKCNSNNYTLVLDDTYIGVEHTVQINDLNRETATYTFVMNVVEKRERNENEHYCSYIVDYIYNQVDCAYFDFNSISTFLCSVTPNKYYTNNLKCQRFKEKTPTQE